MSTQIEPGKQKVYGLMGVVRGTAPKVGDKPDQMVFTWPHLVLREAMVFMILLAVLTALSLLVDAPLEEQANPAKTPNPSKAPWYFLGLQELLHIMPPFWAGIAVPGIWIAYLIVTPYIDKNPSNRPRDRKFAIGFFLAGIIWFAVLTIIGTFFRGPNWEFTLPWVHGIY